MALALAGLLGVAAQRPPYGLVSLEEAYDSNVMNARGADPVTRVTPGVGLLHRDARLTVDLDYRIGLYAYAPGRGATPLNPRASLGARARLRPRLALELGAAAVR